MNKRKSSVFFVLIIIALFCKGQRASERQKSDWLINSKGYVATIIKSEKGKDIVLSNGLLKRTFRIQPNVACTGYLNLSNGQQLLRTVKPEAALIVDGKKYNIGGLHRQKEHAYLLP